MIDGSDATLGNLTVQMPGDQEGILSMERFDGMLTSVKCDEQGVTLAFEDDATFQYAKNLWDWVNGADDHSFLMVAGKGDCGANKYRIPYMISTLAYDEEKNTAKLSGKTGAWQDLLHSYELHVGSVPMTAELGLKRRDYNADASFNMNADFRTKVKVKTGPVFGELVCDPCYTAGQIKFEVIVKSKFFLPHDLVFKMNPQGVKAQAMLEFEIASDFKTNQNIGDTVSLGKIPLAGVTIPGGIFTLGPVLDIGAGVEVTGFEGGVSFGTGATATLPDTAVLEADLLSPSNNKYSSWDPEFTTEPLTAKARVSAYVKLFFVPALKIQAEALGQGFEAGLDLQFPFFEIRGEAVDSPDGGACKEGDKYELALRLRASYGFEFKFNVGRIKSNDEAISLTLGTASYPLGDPLCLGWDIGDNADPGAGTAAGGETPGPRPTSSPGGPSANTCTAKGTSGTCITTAKCKSSGGTSTAGQCPNDPDDVLVSTISI